LHIIKNFAQELLSTLIENLSQIIGSSHCNQDNKVIGSTESCLSSIAEAVESEFLQHMTPYIEGYDKMEDPQKQTLSLIILLSLVKSCSPQSFEKSAPEMIYFLTNLLEMNINSIIIHQKAAEILEQLALRTPQLYLKHPEYTQIREKLLNHIKATPEVINFYQKFYV